MVELGCVSREVGVADKNVEQAQTELNSFGAHGNARFKFCRISLMVCFFPKLIRLPDKDAHCVKDA